MKISLSQRQQKIYKNIRLLGAILFSFSLTAMLFLYVPSLILDINSIQNKTEVIASEDTQPVISTEVEKSNADLSAALEMTGSQALPAPQATQPGGQANIQVNQFSVNIPSIKANSNVIYDVDPFNKEDYLAALKTGVAHASGTGLPGQGRRIFLFAHSTNSPLNFTQFNAVFYQLRLLENGDEIILNLNNEEFKYKVTNKHVVSASDTHWLTEDSSKEQLVLQTCDPPGTSLRRLLVVGERV